MILYVLDRFPCGSERFILRELEELDKLGIPLRILVIGSRRSSLWHGPEPMVDHVWRRPAWLDPRLGLEILLRCLRHPLLAARLFRFAWSVGTGDDRRSRLLAVRLAGLALYLTPRLRARPPDLIHAHFATGPAMLAALLGVTVQRPWGCSVHARDLYSARRHLERRLHAARYVLTCSNTAAKDLAGKLESEMRPKVRCLYHGLDLSEWTQRARPPQRQPARLLAVGRLEAKKGFDVLLAACAHLKATGFRFRCRIVGEGKQARDLAALVSQLGLEEYVEQIAWLSEEKLKEQYRAASFLIVPSKIVANGDRDNIPNVILEALAIGIPVIASDLAAIREVLEPTGAGRLVPPSDPQEISIAIQELTQQPGRRQEMVLRGRQLVERQFDQAANASQLADIFLQQFHDPQAS